MVLGMYPGANAPPGTDFAGTVLAVGTNCHTQFTPGQRVVGFAEGALGTTVVAPAATCVPLPAAFASIDAAGMPTVCMTAHAALNIAGVCAEDVVLVHALSGGVGMAAVQLLQARDACVVGTAGSARKRATLRWLGVEHVLQSRSTVFVVDAAVVRPQGVDVVLNSLTSAGMIAASLAACALGARYAVVGVLVEWALCLLWCVSLYAWYFQAYILYTPFSSYYFHISSTSHPTCIPPLSHHHSRFVEIGKKGIWSPQRMTQERPDIAYHLLALDFWPRTVMGSALRHIVSVATKGHLSALPSRCFAMQDAPQALRTLSQGAHTGGVGMLCVVLLCMCMVGVLLEKVGDLWWQHCGIHHLPLMSAIHVHTETHPPHPTHRQSGRPPTQAHVPRHRCHHWWPGWCGHPVCTPCGSFHHHQPGAPGSVSPGWLPQN